MNRVFVVCMAICVTLAPPFLRLDMLGRTACAQPAEAIDFERARKLFQKRQAGERLTADEEAYVRRAMEARRAGQGRDNRAVAGRDKTGFKPLTEMSADDRYEGQDGGLYGKGKNEPPAEHLAQALKQVGDIRPLNADGEPDEEGCVVLVSISMSNATQEFSRFKQVADADAAKSSRLQIVDCAQGGQAMAEWAPPDAQPWTVAEQRLASARVSAKQVQIAWIKLANKGPRGALEEHGRKLQRDTLAVLHNAKQRFPHLRVVFLGSRIYGGYSSGNLNPEPYAYESAFAARWLIQEQMQGKPDLNWDPAKGEARAPLLLWGPYFWADGITPRQGDHLKWTRDDLAQDGTHPSPAGRDKVAQMLLEFFKTDATAKPWFVRTSPGR